MPDLRTQGPADLTPSNSANVNIGVGLGMSGLSRKDAKEELETLRVRVIHLDYWRSQNYRDPLGQKPVDLAAYVQVSPQVEAQYLAILDEGKRNAAVADAERGNQARW